MYKNFQEKKKKRERKTKKVPGIFAHTYGVCVWMCKFSSFLCKDTYVFLNVNTSLEYEMICQCVDCIIVFGVDVY